MAAPTEPNLRTQWKDVSGMLEHLRKSLAVNSPAWITDQDQLETDLGNFGNDFSQPLMSAVNTARNRLNAALLDAPTMLLPILQQYGALMSPAAPESDGPSLCARLYDYFRTTPITIQSRRFTFGSPTAAGGNAGNGTLQRLTLDAYAYPIENQHADAKIVQCIADGTTGANQHEELFEFRGAAAYKDSIKLTGSGAPFNKQYNARSARNSLLANASFEGCTLTSGSTTNVATSGLTGWTTNVAIVGDGTDYQVDATNYYRGYPGASAPVGLRIYKNAGNSSILTQQLIGPTAPRQTRFDANRPYYYQIAWNRAVGSWTGTLTITLGSQTVNVVASAQAGWQILRIPVNQNLWYVNWAQQNPTVTINAAHTSAANTYVIVDDAVLVPMDPFDGGWYTEMGGATPHLKNDQFTFTDSELGSVMQTWIWRAFGRYLPSAIVAPTNAPTVALSATAGSVTTGTHQVAVTFVDGNGLESAPGPNSGNVTGDGAHNVDVTAIQTGPSGTTKRKLYMSKAGTTTPLYYAGITISDNVTTTATGASGITTNDAGLTVTAPAGITISDPT
jgi:hypothetical protein